MTIIITVLATALGLVAANVYMYIKFLKQRVKDTEWTNEMYLSALQIISNKQPGLVDEAFREIGEEDQ